VMHKNQLEFTKKVKAITATNKRCQSA